VPGALPLRSPAERKGLEDGAPTRCWRRGRPREGLHPRPARPFLAQNSRPVRAVPNKPCRKRSGRRGRRGMRIRAKHECCRCPKGGKKTMPLTIRGGIPAPDFEPRTSERTVHFYDWLGTPGGFCSRQPQWELHPDLATTSSGITWAKNQPEFEPLSETCWKSSACRVESNRRPRSAGAATSKRTKARRLLIPAQSLDKRPGKGGQALRDAGLPTSLGRTPVRTPATKHPDRWRNVFVIGGPDPRTRRFQAVLR